jgi:hypothetical protein
MHCCCGRKDKFFIETDAAVRHSYPQEAELLKIAACQNLPGRVAKKKPWATELGFVSECTSQSE